ncbi:MAG: hypothetical protein WC455_06940 [Dehalococcoidia bacterium]|jgi:hypothetical protein
MKIMNIKMLMGIGLALMLLIGLASGIFTAAPAAAAGTTSVTITKYDAYGNIIGTATVDYLWMEANLPVQSDGTVRYYAQGPTFDNTNFNTIWNPAENVNVESRDYGRPKGTDVKDLCDLAGGAAPGDTIKIKAADNFYKWFDYEDVYNPEPEQGKLVVCWYNADFGGYVPTYDTGMRLLFFADTSVNPMGWHAFGDWDMHETLPESRWHYYSGIWPSSSGLSVQIVSKIEIYEPNLISCDASGNAKDSFAPGETVYVKGLGLAASTSYKLWIQAEPVSNNKLSIVAGNDPVLLPAYEFNTGNDPSSAQETVTTSVSGDFSPTAIWTISTSATPQKYDIVADSQALGTIGKYDSKDYIDNPGWEGFRVTEAPLTITAGAGDNGSIDPSGDVTVDYGSSQTFDITADPGYHVADVLVDGSSVGAVTSYEFTNVTADHTISASFASDSTAPDWDLNGDHICNIGDVVVIGLHWGQTGTPGWIPQDVNNDGIINIGDVVVIGLHWGESW